MLPSGVPSSVHVACSLILALSGARGAEAAICRKNSGTPSSASSSSTASISGKQKTDLQLPTIVLTELDQQVGENRSLKSQPQGNRRHKNIGRTPLIRGPYPDKMQIVHWRHHHAGFQ